VSNLRTAKFTNKLSLFEGKNRIANDKQRLNIKVIETDIGKITQVGCVVFQRRRHAKILQTTIFVLENI
jgi:hypothetical protein